MRTAIICGALALTVTTAGAAERNASSANTIMPGCQAALSRNWSDPTAAYRFGAIAGLAHVATFPDIVFQPLHKRFFCLSIPDGVTGFQMVKVVVAYIDARPARMHEDFHMLAFEALRTAWPCKDLE